MDERSDGDCDRSELQNSYDDVLGGLGKQRATILYSFRRNTSWRCCSRSSLCTTACGNRTEGYVSKRASRSLGMLLSHAAYILSFPLAALARRLQPLASFLKDSKKPNSRGQLTRVKSHTEAEVGTLQILRDTPRISQREVDPCNIFTRQGGEQMRSVQRLCVEASRWCHANAIFAIVARWFGTGPSVSRNPARTSE